MESLQLLFLNGHLVQLILQVVDTLPDIVVALGEADWLIFLLVVVLLLGFQLLGQLLKLDLLLLDAELLVLVLHILLLVVLSTLHEVNSDLGDFLGGLIDDWVEFVFLLLFGLGVFVFAFNFLIFKF